MGYSYTDEWENKNLYSSPRAIDERQSLELLVLLDKWEKNEVPPWQVMFQAAYITGTTLTGFLQGYSFNRIYIKEEGGEFPKEFTPEYCQKVELEYTESLAVLKSLLRPEMQDRNAHEAAIVHDIRLLRTMLEEGKADSWSAAIAIASALLKPEMPDLEWWGQRDHPLIQFEREVRDNEKRCKENEKSAGHTVALFTPETEESIKKEMAHFFATKRAKEEWEENHKEEGWSRSSFEWAGRPGAPREDEDVPFIPPIDYPDRFLCNEIHIAPSGTALISIYEKDEDYRSWEEDIYGTTVARITTYSVTFVPKHPDDLMLLRDTITKAQDVLWDLPYRYESPNWTETGKSYSRGGTYVDTKNGKAQPLAYFDLDDLWRLYYLLEPILEPGVQIAAAMNAARYAEERGAPLDPDFDYLDNGHNVANDSGYLKSCDPKETLTKALRDSFIDLALEKIDMAEFFVRLGTLADHTLTGRIRDSQGVLSTYDQMIADARRSKEIMTYEKAWVERTQNLLRGLLGLSRDSKTPLYVSLKGALHEISEPLKTNLRDLERKKEIESREARWNRVSSQMDSLNFLPSKFLDLMAQSDLALKYSDALAGILGKSGEELEDERKSGITTAANLIVADSEVETCIDGLHAEGRYISRTKGSPFVRKELPNALKPFCPEGAQRPSLKKLLSSPEIYL